MMPVSIGHDHRIIDGAVAAQSMDEMKKFLQNWSVGVAAVEQP
jgi:pyruvate/2-oxoglutarate dehydrogenase complex dihydrolipoamide acyltransferase (E2) component